LTRLLVIEDNENLAFGLRNNLEIEGYEVEVALTGEEGIALARSTRPALIVLDLMLPGVDGLRVLRTIRTAGYDSPVLVLTARGEEVDKVRALKLGADDYVTKPFGVLEVLARIEALLRRTNRGREREEGPTLERAGDIAVERATHSVSLRGAPVELSPKEYDLLVALLRRRGAVATRLELLREVWGYDSSVMTRTVDAHVASLRRKLEEDAANPTRLLTVRKAGYRLA
jgi:two-component system, OmpR family, alkaline phosphatase synthesis response regulator PhoP